MKSENVMAVVLVLVFVLGIALGSLAFRSNFRGEAIQAGVAEYRIDKTNGAVTFNWITNSVTEKK